MTQSRQLAAIMFTDIVGYTAIMEADEERAFELLDKNRNLQRPIIENHGGKLLKEMGDGILASFPTITSSVYCALEIQKTCESNPDLKLRIGIHQGEVVFDGNDVFGSGVNIASRLEPLAPIGGILVSESVYKNVLNKKGIFSKFAGEKELKGVNEPVKVFQIMTDKAETDKINPYSVLRSKLSKSSKKIGYAVAGVLTILLVAYFLYNKANALQDPLEPQIEITDKSIAVLPFANMSNDPEQQYFSDGIMEAILNNLTKIGELKVISRTSVMQYRNTEKTSPQIAEELGVAFLLEGGVQTVEGKVRINAQLIDAVQDKHVWSENYDRELADIFAIQSEIAQKIASQLKAILTPKEIEQIDKQRTDNLEAYNSYLMGRYFWNKRTEQSLKKSVEYFEQALAADSEYASAHAGLADAYLVLLWMGELPRPDGSSKIREQALNALEIDPKLAEAHATLGCLAYFEWRWQEAETELVKAIELNPNYATARQWYAEYLDTFGQSAEAREQFNRALELDPLSLMIHIMSSANYYNAGELDKALKENQKVLELDKNRARPYWSSFIIYREQRRDKEAFKQLKKMWSMDSSTVKYAELTEGIYNETGIDGVIRWWMDAEVNESPNDPVFIAHHYAILGEKELALEWLERAFEMHSIGLIRLKHNRMFDGLRSEPRFAALLEKMGLEADY